MPDDSSLIPVNHANAIELISRYIYQVLVTSHQQHPEWLHEKFRNQAWHSPSFQTKLISRLVEELQKAVSQDELILKVMKIAQNFLLSSFFGSTDFIEFMSRIHQLTQAEPKSELKELTNSSLKLAGTPEASAAGMTILLLDAENLQINVEVETFLASCCTYPLRIKIAFANWRNMGKQDTEYHGRGYELIHVPAGKDSADVKMAIVGASIFLHYPTAKEVLVCSSDKALTHLRNTLQAHGLTVYLAHKQGETITVLNTLTGKSESLPLQPLPGIDRFISQLKELILNEQKTTSNLWIKLARISHLYQSKYKIPISQVVAGHFPGKKPVDIFNEYPDEFALHQINKNAETYITLFKVAEPISKEESKELLPITEVKTEPKPLLEIDSKTELEQALVKIITASTAKSTDGYVAISYVGSEFSKQYGIPVVKVMQHFNLGSKFYQFLQSCPAFKLKKHKKEYQVAIAKP
jgi:hypothetical protein